MRCGRPTLGRPARRKAPAPESILSEPLLSSSLYKHIAGGKRGVAALHRDKTSNAQNLMWLKLECSLSSFTDVIEVTIVLSVPVFLLLLLLLIFFCVLSTS